MTEVGGVHFIVEIFQRPHRCPTRYHVSYRCERSLTSTDMDMALDRIVPEDFPWLHTDEGPEFVAFLFP